MTLNSENTLVVLSIPFQRLIRSHLSPIVLEVLTMQASVVIVSPFADDINFVHRYKGQNIYHALGPTLKGRSWLACKMEAIASVLRMQGYWRRYRRKIPYYWENRHVEFKDNGNDTTMSMPHRLIIDLLALIAYHPLVWKLFNCLDGKWRYAHNELTDLTNRYHRVILIQAASWGFQDAALGYLGKKFSWRTVMMPYTTDQLFCNGNLYCDFDKVCVQGEAEERWAKEFHQILPERLVKLGSAYMKVLGDVKNSQTPFLHNNSVNRKRIMYAGLVPRYFPEECEIEAVVSLVNLLSNLQGEEWELIYRPAHYSQDAIEKIKREVKCSRNLVIQIPSAYSLGLDIYVDLDPIQELTTFIENIESIDILVTSLTTSLSIDAAKFNIPSISYFPKENKMFKSRQSELLLNDRNETIGLESVPVAFNLTELQEVLFNLMKNDAKKMEIVVPIIKDWDFPDSEFKRIFKNAVFDDIHI